MAQQGSTYTAFCSVLLLKLEKGQPVFVYSKKAGINHNQERFLRYIARFGHKGPK